MSIEVLKNRVFVLNTFRSTYAVYLNEQGQPLNAYWGALVERAEDFTDSSFGMEPIALPPPQLWQEEYAPFGGLRFKEAAVKVTFASGTRDLRFAVTGYEVDEDTLSLTLQDEQCRLELRLFYRVYEQTDIIERWCSFHNHGEQAAVLERCHSAQFALPGVGYRSINFSGRWSGEFQQRENEVACGKQVYESLCGLTGHQCTPAFVVHRGADEDNGDVWFGALGYSGNFKIVVENVCNHYLNIVAGISDSDFAWQLNPGESFETPHIYAGYANGFTAMSQHLHCLARESLLPRGLAKQPLPVLYNSWYATEFAVNEQQQCALADKAATLGVELFVVDDGWFSGRADSTGGLGDWTPCTVKFPNGLLPLISHVRQLGMKFGLWVEPEMVNPNSALYRGHPNWILRYSDREPILWRSQYMLDMAQQEVRDYLFEALHRLLEQNPIDYLKWDMNRYAAEMGSSGCQPNSWKSLWHRHTLGVYELAKRLREAHPSLELEACASGGGRVDLGAMGYFDEFWTSDNTDPLDRLAMQQHYSLLYPAKCMRAWITGDSAFNGRTVPLSFAAHVSMCGALGIGLDLNAVPPEQMTELAGYIDLYKRIRGVVQLGKLYRLSDAERDTVQLVQYLLRGKIVVFAFLHAGQYGCRLYRCKLKGLCEDTLYRYKAGAAVAVKSGAYLMGHGIELELHGDWSSQIVELSAV